MSKNRQKKNYLLLWAVFQRIRTIAVRAIPSRQCNFFNVIGILAMCYFFVTMASVVRERNNQHSVNEVIVQVNSLSCDLPLIIFIKFFITV